MGLLVHTFPDPPLSRKFAAPHAAQSSSPSFSQISYALSSSSMDSVGSTRALGHPARKTPSKGLGEGVPNAGPSSSPLTSLSPSRTSKKVTTYSRKDYSMGAISDAGRSEYRPAGSGQKAAELDEHDAADADVEEDEEQGRKGGEDEGINVEDTDRRRSGPRSGRSDRPGHDEENFDEDMPEAGADAEPALERRADGDGHDEEDMLLDEEEEEPGEEVGRVIVNVEVRLISIITVQTQVIEQNVRAILGENFKTLRIGTDVPRRMWGDTILGRNVERIWIADSVPDKDDVPVEDVDLRIHCYHANSMEALNEFVTMADDDEEDQVPAASIRDLPSTQLDGIWETLIYADRLKQRLLNYIQSTIAFSEAMVDFNVVSWNRMVLLHGPPGTGKTSLCRGLAQKLCIRLSQTYPRGKLVEINSHSLFSRWFSESGKLVQKLFSSVTEMVEDERCFVVVMMDEVESLTAARAGAMSGGEPSDAVRVVNALLTQLDKLKTRKNVLVVTTSNIAGSIDSAFLDRADIVEYVDYPPAEAVYWILASCLNELMEKGLVRRCNLLDWQAVLPTNDPLKVAAGSAETGAVSSPLGQANGHGHGRENGRQKRAREAPEIKSQRISRQLKNLAFDCRASNLAGRFLRRLPVLAHARYLSSTSSLGSDGGVRARDIDLWMQAMRWVVRTEAEKRRSIAEGTNTVLGGGGAATGGGAQG